MNADEEMDRLIAAFIDGTLDEADREALERYLRDDPQAISRAAEAVRYEVALSDAVRPDHLELVQQRRLIIDRATGRPVVVESTERVGRPGTFVEHPVTPPRKQSPWLIAGPVLAVVAGAGAWLVLKDRKTPEVVPPAHVWQIIPLKNPGFELPILGDAPAKSPELQSWQDKYSTPNAMLESAPSGGAHGGNQVAVLAAGGHIKQLLFDAKGEAVIFEPGTRIRLSGWSCPMQPISGRADVIQTALHFVDDLNLQYVVTYRIAPLDGSGWRRFSVELVVPDQETFEPSYRHGEVANVRGRQILLSLTNISSQKALQVAFMLDDMTLEILPPQGSGGTR